MSKFTICACDWGERGEVENTSWEIYLSSAFLWLCLIKLVQMHIILSTWVYMPVAWFSKIFTLVCACSFDFIMCISQSIGVLFLMLPFVNASFCLELTFQVATETDIQFSASFTASLCWAKRAGMKYSWKLLTEKTKDILSVYMKFFMFSAFVFSFHLSFLTLCLF